MTVASALDALNTDIQNARTAITNKGGTVTANGGSSQLATDIATIPSGGGGGKYQLLERISDDSNNEIGTVSGFFTDGNDVEYAVVCLDAQYRLALGKWCSGTGSVTNLPIYNDLITANWRTATETATFNTQKILDYCTAKGYTSTACTHCRSKSFTVDGTTYYGQLPNIVELNDIGTYIVEINNADTSASSYSSLNFSSSKTMWASSQYNSSECFYLGNGGGISHGTKTANTFVCPVLEIPNN